MNRSQKVLSVILLAFVFQARAVDLGSPKILIDPAPATEKESKLEDSNPNSDVLLKMIEEVVSREHPEMFARWQKHLRSQNLDPDNEERTLKRLQQKYLETIQSWGTQITECESGRASSRWLRRLRRKFGTDDVSEHKKQIAKIITSLYLKRKTECMQSHEEKALRAERELYAFSLERMRLLIDFISQNSELKLSQLSKMRLLSSLKRKQSMHTLSDRSVDLNSLRLETKLQNLPKIYVDFLAHEQSFKKPFDLHKNLSFLSSEFDDVQSIKKTPPEKKLKKQLDLDLSNPG